MQKKKIIRRDVKQTLSALATELHPLLQKIYAHRGIKTHDELNRELNDLLPFTQLLNIDKAVDLLIAAMQHQERILIIGDFDADGATSSALMISCLRALGANDVEYLVPNRFEFGYGLTEAIVDVAAKLQPKLLITVDNGISSIEGVAKAKAFGIKVLVTDHHLPGKTLPAADAIVNPNQPGDVFPSKNLAGVGVAFYVLLALRRKLSDMHWFRDQNIAEPNMGDFLDLVALGTYADVVALDKNNRILVHQGLQRIRNGRTRPGIQALIEISKREAPKLQAADLGFALGPRINAAGRLDDMSLGIECLLAKDLATAREKAKILDELNHERRFIEDEMQAQALTYLRRLNLAAEKELPLGLCIYDPEWHQGVIGILASRIKDRYHRPVIAFANSHDDEIKGSARSIEGIHIRDTLDAIAAAQPDLISKFGGHAMAAGLSIRANHLARFAKAFALEVARQLGDKLPSHDILSDGSLEKTDFVLGTAELIRNSGPWGQAFPEPLFDDIFELREQRIVGQKHLKCTLAKENVLIDAIFFNADIEVWPNHRCRQVQAAYRLDVNEYLGVRKLQLIIEHLVPIE